MAGCHHRFARLPMTQRLVLASNNAGKLKEFNEMLSTVGFSVHAQGEFNVPEADEPHHTFVENALEKARHAARLTGLPALADDSGICVDALGGAPGLYSARYSGVHGDAQANIDKLLLAMKDVPEGRRAAHFYAVIVLLRHPGDPQPIIAEGVWPGIIIDQRRGTGGFGYNPVFLDPDYGLTAAEMDTELKNRLSHRGRALAALRQKLLDAIR